MATNLIELLVALREAPEAEKPGKVLESIAQSGGEDAKALAAKLMEESGKKEDGRT